MDRSPFGIGLCSALYTYCGVTGKSLQWLQLIGSGCESWFWPEVGYLFISSCQSLVEGCPGSIISLVFLVSPEGAKWVSLEWAAGTGQTSTEVVSTKESLSMGSQLCVVDKPTSLRQFCYGTTTGIREFSGFLHQLNAGFIFPYNLFINWLWLVFIFSPLN